MTDLSEGVCEQVSLIYLTRGMEWVMSVCKEVSLIYLTRGMEWVTKVFVNRWAWSTWYEVWSELQRCVWTGEPDLPDTRFGVSYKGVCVNRWAWSTWREVWGELWRYVWTGEPDLPDARYGVSYEGVCEQVSLIYLTWGMEWVMKMCVNRWAWSAWCEVWSELWRCVWTGEPDLPDARYGMSYKGVCEQVSLIYLTRGMGRVVKGLLVMALLGLLAVVFTPLGFPFASSDDAASKQRVIFLVSVW